MCNKEPHPFLQLNFLAAQGSILPSFKFLPQLPLPLFLLDSDLLPYSWRIWSPKHCLKSSQTVPYLFPIYMDHCSTFWASIHLLIHHSLIHTFPQTLSAIPSPLPHLPYHPWPQNTSHTSLTHLCRNKGKEGRPWTCLLFKLWIVGAF